MNNTKKNHFVSQVYLRAFSGSNGKVLTTVRTPRGWDAIKEKNPSEICYWQDFYSLIYEHGFDRATLEQQFQRIFENKWPDVLSRIQNAPLNLYQTNNLVKNNFFSPMN